jgi:hypothetical protein
MKRKLIRDSAAAAMLLWRTRSSDDHGQAQAALAYRSRVCHTLAAVGLLLGSQTALAADASEYLFLPTVTQGEREIDWHFGVGSSGVTTGAASNSGIGFGMGVTEHWFTEVAVEYHKQAAYGTALDAFEWENILQLAEPNEWPVDIGVVCIVEKPHNAREGMAVRAGPLFQKEFGHFQANLNILLVQHFQSALFPATQIRYQSQIKYRYSQPFEFGLQAFGDLASPTQSWTAYSAQVHRVGPVVLGRFVLSGERSLSYNAAFLVGTTAHSPDRTLRMQIEYEF